MITVSMCRIWSMWQYKGECVSVVTNFAHPVALYCLPENMMFHHASTCFSLSNRSQWTVDIEHGKVAPAKSSKWDLWTPEHTWKSLKAKIILEQGFLISALLTFWVALFFVVGWQGSE